MEWLVKNYQYEFWAIQCYIDAIEKADFTVDQLPQEIIKLLSHIVVAQRIWISRLTNTQNSLEPWSTLKFDGIQLILSENRTLFGEFLSSSNEQSLEETIDYQNTKGTLFTTKVIEILQHITHHSAYHRGQLSLLFKSNSLEIPSTDYIYYIRLQS